MQQTFQPSVFARDDTFFGVCHALGEDFGFNPNYLRAALAVGLFWNPVAMVAAYAGAGLVVAATRWLYPNPRIPVVEEPQIGESSSDDAQQELALAA